MYSLWHVVCFYRKDINSTYDTHSQILLQSSGSHSENIYLIALCPIIGFMIYKALYINYFIYGLLVQTFEVGKVLTAPFLDKETFSKCLCNSIKVTQLVMNIHNGEP